MPTSRRARRWLIALAILAALGLVAVGLLGRLLQPERLTPLILGRAGEALGLELATEAPVDYALRPEPRLVLPGFTATVPGEATPLLRARRIELALPWSTLRGGDGPVTVTRIRLVAPELDVDALRRWLDARPAGPDTGLDLPVLTDGLEIENGRVRGAGWALEALRLELPELVPGAPARVEAAAVVDVGGDRLYPIQVVLAATPSTPAGDLLLDALRLDLDAPSPLPALETEGMLRWGATIRLALQGRLEDWPREWPVLPLPDDAAPSSPDATPLAFALRYDGGPDLAGALRIELARHDAQARIEAAPAAVLEWLDAPTASPLPPLRGRVEIPVLETAGVRASGVVVELQDATPADADGD
uniref:DUF748 domain-containing protein n=1 Tax=Coralloluteibacterium stylophorae TaxID=1776034 RepID=A0A8J7VRN8_9GAMM